MSRFFLKITHFSLGDGATRSYIVPAVGMAVC